MRTAMPMPYLAFYPGLKLQDELKEKAILLGEEGETTFPAGRPSKYEPLDDRRLSYDPEPSSTDFGQQTKPMRLGDIALGRSGDKGANVNFGIFPKPARHWDWLRCFMTRAKLQELIGDDWREDYFIERMEFPNIHAVHFVVYRNPWAGCSSSTLLDNLGKGFTDYIRDKIVEVPISIL
jgi:hypothetical protein